jgi:Flp pilus assembly protein TadB
VGAVTGTGAAALFGLAGAAAGLGLLLIVRGWRAVDAPAGPSRWAAWWALRRGRRPWRRTAAATAAAIVVGAATGWVVGALLAALAVWGLPGLLGADREFDRRVARVEAVAVWTETLRDTLAASAGLHQAIAATAATAPEAIRGEVGELAARLHRRERLAPALRAFADDLADPGADLVVAALVLAAEHQARRLAPLLGELAATARAQVEMRRRVHTGRARTRATMRIVVATTLVFAAGLVLFNRGFLAPYGTAAGQLVLLASSGRTRNGKPSAPGGPTAPCRTSTASRSRSPI